MKQIFEKDPVDFFLHNFGMEESENGREIAEKIFELFDREKPIDQQMKTMEQVEYVEVVPSDLRVPSLFQNPGHVCCIILLFHRPSSQSVC